MPFLRYCELMLAVSIVALSLLSGCAGTIPATPKDQRAPTDPWEPINRRLMNFNEGVDKVTFKPLAKGYQKVVRNIMRQGRIDKLTCRRGLALPNRGLNALYVDMSAHLERILTSKDA